MDIESVLKSLENCECGKEHNVDIKKVAIGRGMLKECGKILKECDFPSNILVVSDENELKASDGIIDILKNEGFEFELKVYPDLRVADADLVREIVSMSGKHKGILSVGSGSCNDICRRSALLADKEFAIFATAPSMDGFASNSAPITENNFKTSLPARQPSIIIADTEILAKAPARLKTAGFGDVLAKYNAIADWRIANLVIGEYYCEKIAALVKQTLAKMTRLADKVTLDDPETAGEIMEALVWAGLLMKLTDNSRPASGTEHIVSHYWEVKKLEKGINSDFHGRKVGVATLIISRLYHDIINRKDIRFHSDATDWKKVYSVYGKNLEPDVRKLNEPTVTENISPDFLESKWEEICNIVREELPTPDVIESLLIKAGGAKTLDDIEVDRELGAEGLLYHTYMRHRLTLMRLLPMTDIEFDAEKYID